MLRDLHHRIDDERADVESCDGQKRADEAQDDQRDADRGARLPDELQEGREVAEGADALANGLRRCLPRVSTVAWRWRAASHRVLTRHSAILSSRTLLPGNAKD